MSFVVMSLRLVCLTTRCYTTLTASSSSFVQFRLDFLAFFAPISEFKMISAQHSSNNGKNLVTKKSSYHGNILNKGKKILSRFKLSS